MKILIIDDSQLWINQGQKLLEAADHTVTSLLVTDPSRYTSDQLTDDVRAAVDGVDVLLCDKDLGSATSTPLLCVLREHYPKLPIIRWTGDYERTSHMEYLGISKLEKPTREKEADFVEEFNKALGVQSLILSGPMGIFASLDETSNPGKHKAESSQRRLVQLTEIAQLAEKSLVERSDNPRYPWTLETIEHELGHCVCDGNITVEDIQPHLAALQTIVEQMEAKDLITERFRICADFIKEGNLDEHELVLGCY